ncbi:MAG TPA: Uma2 family endonuclease [Gemmataceae bacterium]|nr:Uma2 family endonuclease [Gemmataceae bacterium]
MILQDDVNGEVQIPDAITSIQTFRRWATSDALPRHGRFSFLCGTFHMDLSMEELFTHNQVRLEYTTVLTGITRSDGSGYFFPDRALLTNVRASLSTEPDGTFVFYDTIRSRRVRLKKSKEHGYVELVGAPDMVLEIVSESSVRKDYEILRELYWKAKIAEYWLVDVRKGSLLFEILRCGPRGYVSIRRHTGGWLASSVFGRSFRLKQKTDPLGNPEYTLEVRK